MSDTVQYTGGRKAVLFRLPSDDYTQLAREAARQLRPVANLVAMVISDYVRTVRDRSEVGA